MRARRLVFSLFLIAAIGCGSSAPPPPTPPAPPPQIPSAAAPNTPLPSTTAAPTTAPESGPPTTPPKSPPAATAPSGSPPATALRDLAARLVERSDDAWRINEQAATELEKLAPMAGDSLVPLLADKQVEVRRGAAFYLLRGFNPNSAEQVAAFTGLLEDTDRTIRGIGLSAVKDMRPEDQAKAAPQLATMLDHRREETAANRAAIARLLGALKTDGAPALEQLSTAAQGDPDPLVRSACLAAIAQVVPADQASPLVAKGLSDKEATVRLVAAVRLRQLGAESAAATKELAAALADADSRVRAAVAEALIRIGKPAASALAGQLTSASLDARKLALACLAKIGPDAKDALAAVEKCLSDDDEEVKKLATAALARIKSK